MVSEWMLLYLVLIKKKYAIPTTYINNVERIVKISPLNSKHPFLIGVIDYHGDVIPVVDLRLRFDPHEKDIEIGNYLLIFNLHSYQVAMPVDDVQEVLELNAFEVADIRDKIGENTYVKGILKHSTGLILMNDLDALFPRKIIKQWYSNDLENNNEKKNTLS